eukprot:6343157-Prymnesium_polylepis.1
MGDYLARAVAAKAVQMGLAEAAAFKGLNLDALAEQLRDDEWAKGAQQRSLTARRNNTLHSSTSTTTCSSPSTGASTPATRGACSSTARCRSTRSTSTRS